MKIYDNYFLTVFSGSENKDTFESVFERKKKKRKRKRHNRYLRKNNIKSIKLTSPHDRSPGKGPADFIHSPSRLFQMWCRGHFDKYLFRFKSSLPLPSLDREPSFFVSVVAAPRVPSLLAPKRKKKKNGNKQKEALILAPDLTLTLQLSHLSFPISNDGNQWFLSLQISDP